jgi:hypothetical protein
MDEANVSLSVKEKELVMNADWILTKNALMKKARRLLENVQRLQHVILQDANASIPAEILVTPAKISKGENYLGLPYLMLDHPRHFQKPDVFAIRTMFWWGNYFSTTLHLSGKYKEAYSAAISGAYTQLSKNGFFICVHPDEWQHHFENDNYSEISSVSQKDFASIVEDKPFVKIANRISLADWDDASVQLSGIFRKLIGVTAH